MRQFQTFPSLFTDRVLRRKGTYILWDNFNFGQFFTVIHDKTPNKFSLHSLDTVGRTSALLTVSQGEKNGLIVISTFIYIISSFEITVTLVFLTKSNLKKGIGFFFEKPNLREEILSYLRLHPKRERGGGREEPSFFLPVLRVVRT